MLTLPAQEQKMATKKYRSSIIINNYREDSNDRELI